MKINTKCVQEGYKSANGDPRVLPIYQSTAFKFDSGEFVGKLFNLEASGHFYSRLSNPTVEFVENKIAALEGGTGAILTSSGQAASFFALFNICSAGDHIVSSTAIYGGTFNLLAVTFKKMGIDVTFVDHNAPEEEIQKAFKENTKAVFAETLSNPTLEVLDIEKMAKIAHKNGVPLIVDNTFPTPILCRPIEFGADIVIHSTTKYMDGHATVLGGVVVDSGNFDWTNGKFPELTEPDNSYHGLVYTRDVGKNAYIVKARVQLMRDLGSAFTPFSAFLLNEGLETLHLRMERHSSNALAVAEFLELDERISWVNYPLLKSSKYYERAQKYLKGGASGVISFGLKGGREAAVKFMDSLKLAAIVVHVADIRTCILHPASTTHRQLSDEQLEAAKISPEMVRMSIGIEDKEDIIEDIKQAL